MLRPVKDWFTSRYAPARRKGTPLGANAPAGPTTGTFVSTESLKTFAGATAAVTAIWAGTEKGFGLPHADLVGLLVSLLVGAALLALDLTDPNRSVEPRVPLRVLAAVVNAFIVFGAASSALSPGMNPSASRAPLPDKPAAVARPG